MSKNKVIIMGVICAILALLFAACFTAAYFGQNRKFQGTLNFASGIVLEYKNIDINNNNMSLLKLGNSRTIEDFSGAGDLTKLDETSNNVASEEVFYLANPGFKPAEDTINYFLRVKLEFYTQTESGSRLLTEQEMLNVFGNTNPLTVAAPTNDTSGFVLHNGYYYLVKAGETAIDGYSNLYVNTNVARADIQLFVSDGINNGVSYTKLELAKVVDYYLVQNFKININVEAIDANENLLDLDIWQLID